MPLSAAEEEAYAYVRPSDLWCEAVEFDHLLLPGTLRFINGLESQVSLPPRSGEAAQPFTPVAFSFREGAKEAKEGPGEGELSVDGISSELRQHLRTVANDGYPIDCTVLIYRFTVTNGTANFSVMGPHQRYTGFRIEKVSLSATSARAQLKVRDWGRINFPRMTFNRALYPGLHG